METTRAGLDADVQRIDAMSYAELAAMKPDEVRGHKGAGIPALSDAARERRVERMLAERATLFTLDDFAIRARLAKASPIKWRNRNLQTGEVNRDALVPDDATPPGSRTPFWYAGTGWLWLKQADRVDADLFPTGRPRGDRRAPAQRTP